MTKLTLNIVIIFLWGKCWNLRNVTSFIKNLFYFSIGSHSILKTLWLLFPFRYRCIRILFFYLCIRLFLLCLILCWRFLQLLFDLSFDLFRCSMLCNREHLPFLICLCTYCFMFLYSIRCKLSSTKWTRNSIILIYLDWMFTSNLLLFHWRFHWTWRFLRSFISISTCVLLWTIIISSSFLFKAWGDHLNSSLLFYFFLWYLWVLLLQRWWFVDFSLSS